MSDAPKRVWMDETSEDEVGMFIVSKTDKYANMDIEYVRKDIADELAEALKALDREFADQAIAEAEYLAEEGNHAMQECANRSASVWLKARAALAKYKETET